jgi:hypothetical protein
MEKESPNSQRDNLAWVSGISIKKKDMEQLDS